MLFNTENENVIIYNARDCSVMFMDRKWYELPSEKSIPVGYHMVGRAGAYRFYIPTDVRAEVSNRYDGYFVRGDVDVR